jgi:hypothetical protein
VDVVGVLRFAMNRVLRSVLPPRLLKKVQLQGGK